MQKPNGFKGFSRVLSGGDGLAGLRPMFEAFFFAHWVRGPAVSTAANAPARSLESRGPSSSLRGVRSLARGEAA
jgi:hypothetical protein